MGKLWSVEGQLMEESYLQVAEYSGIDTGYEVLQILADPLERQFSENREQSARRWKQTSAFPVRATSGGSESRGR